MSRKACALLILASLCAFGLLFFLSNARSWEGARPVALSFRTINRDTGRAIPGVVVELIDPFDDERPRVKGQTLPDGHVTLTNRFGWYGSDIGPWRIGERVSFYPWLVYAHAPGFSEFRAPLASIHDYPNALLAHLDVHFPLTAPR